MKKIEINTYQKPLLFDYNGLFDDFLSLTTMLTLSEYRLIGLSIVKGDCCVDPVVDATLRILKLFCRNDIEIVLPQRYSNSSWRFATYQSIPFRVAQQMLAY